MENIKEFVIGILKKRGYEITIKEVMQMSDEHIEWLKDVAVKYVRSTKEKYPNLPPLDEIVMSVFMNEEYIKMIEELKRHERESRQQKTEKASASMIYLFPIGEA